MRCCVGASWARRALHVVHTVTALRRAVVDAVKQLRHEPVMAPGTYEAPAGEHDAKKLVIGAKSCKALASASRQAAIIPTALLKRPFTCKTLHAALRGGWRL